MENIRKSRIAAGLSAACFIFAMYEGYQTATDTVHESGHIVENITHEVVGGAKDAVSGLAGHVLGKDSPKPAADAKPDESLKTHVIKIATWQENIEPKILPAEISHDIVAGTESMMISFGAGVAALGFFVGERRREKRLNSESREFQERFERFTPYLLQLEQQEANQQAWQARHEEQQALQASQWGQR